MDFGLPLFRRSARSMPTIQALAGLLLTASSAAAQSVTAPTLDSATLRARLGRTMAPPGRPVPADAASLDAMLTQGQLTELVKRLSGTQDIQAVMLDMNWEQARLFSGAGFIVVYAYMTDLWRVGSSLPGSDGDQMKQSASMMFVYALDLVKLDGVKCADVSAPGHRQDQLFAQNRPVLDYVRSLPQDRRMILGTVSLAVESATAPLRTNDAVLCSGGLDQISAGLKAQGNRPLSQLPSTMGKNGKTYLVPPAPGYTPTYIAPAAWQSKQAAIRAALPAQLTSLLSLPGDAHVAK